MNFTYFIGGVILIILGVVLTIWVYRKPLTFKEDPKNPMRADDYHIYESWHKWMNIDGYYVGIAMMILGVVLIFKSTPSKQAEIKAKQSKIHKCL